MKRISFALMLTPLLLLAADTKPADPPKIPAELQLDVERKINQNLVLQMQMQQARQAYDQLMTKMQAVCSDKGFTLQRAQSGDWFCAAKTAPSKPAGAIPAK